MLCNAGASIENSIDGFLSSASMKSSNISDFFVKTFDFCIAFLKIDGFPGTHGTRSKGAPALYSFLFSHSKTQSFFVNQFRI